MNASANEPSLTADKLPERSWPAGADYAREQLDGMYSQGARIQLLLEAGLLRCPLGHRFDVQHAGRCAEIPTAHLDPFPLLLQDGVVKVALTS